MPIKRRGPRLVSFKNGLLSRGITAAIFFNMAHGEGKKAMSDNHDSISVSDTPDMEPRRSRKAAVAFLLSLTGLFLWVVGAVPAIIVAVLAKREMGKDKLIRGRMAANTALALGVLEVILFPVLFWAVLVHGPFSETERVAHFHLSGTLGESPHADVVGTFMGRPATFHSLFTRLGDAKEDESVRAVLLTFDNLNLRLPEMEELRTAVLDFKSSGKRVFAHCEDQWVPLPLYTVLAAASRASITPTMSLDLRGLYAESMYLKDGLANIGVASDVVHIGDYKSAGEMLSCAAPSDAAKENMNWVIDGQYQSCLAMLAESRGMSMEDVSALIDKSLIPAEDALRQGLVDAVEYQDDFVGFVRREYGAGTPIDNDYHREALPELDMARPLRSLWNVARYFARLDRPGAGDCVGLIYLNGNILGGHGSPDNACGGDIRAAFKEAMEDDSIKAVVLRVNSPGGLVTASEVIHRAAVLLQERKPLVVSMGGVAASGGYFVSCGAGTIFANETTITGSIGVIGSKLVTADMWQKLGVNWFACQRGANADLFSGQHPFTGEQRRLLTENFEGSYSSFKEHVEAGRGAKLTKHIDELAGGRVYTGRQALELGLVDKIGGLQAAIAFAAQSVSMKKYQVRVVPEPKDALALLARALVGEPASPSDLETGPPAPSKGLGSLTGTSPDARTMALLLESLDRPHAEAAIETLQRLRLISQEGMAFLMPQVLVIQ